MADLADNVAVIPNGNILLTKREDFETWILPGGSVEQGESLAQQFYLKMMERVELREIPEVGDR